METIIHALIFAIAWRIRGGMGNELVRKLLKKPEFVDEEKTKRWEIPNFYCWSAPALVLTISSISSIWSPVVFGLAIIGCSLGYLEQIAKLFGFKSGFNLDDKELRTWKNYALLSARGMWTCLPLALVSQLSLFFPLLEYPYSPHLWYGVMAGAIMPACYRIGFMIPEKKGVISHSQYGEWMYGLAVGVALYG